MAGLLHSGMRGDLEMQLAMSESGSNSVIAVMSAARLFFHRKRKSISDLAMSLKCHNRL
jgi:hypothetical protein